MLKQTLLVHNDDISVARLLKGCKVKRNDFNNAREVVKGIEAIEQLIKKLTENKSVNLQLANTDHLGVRKCLIDALDKRLNNLNKDLDKI